MKNQTKWSVATRLNVMSAMIILSGLFGIVGAVEINKGAKMHEFNFRHVKHNHLFFDEVLAFENDPNGDTRGIQQELLMIRKQPSDCLEIIGVVERLLMSTIGTYEAIEICHRDMQLVDNTLAALRSYQAAKISKPEFVRRLKFAIAGFTQHSVEFEPLVNTTVNTVSMVVIGFVILKAMLVAVFGYMLSRGVAEDYKKLESTEASLEIANDELKQFAYRTSHDFKSPLIGIRSMSSFIQEDLAVGNLDEAIVNAGRIAAKVESLEKVVENTLELAKADLSETRADDIDLEDLVQQIFARLAEFSEGYNVDLVAGAGIQDVKIRTDESRLTTTIENLISNGIKYSNGDCDHSFVKVDADISESGTTKISIRDNGLGIPGDHQAEVFEMFKQFHPQRANGTGLGMYIVKKNIEKLNATIDFSSSGDGTCFEISIPT